MTRVATALTAATTAIPTVLSKYRRPLLRYLPIVLVELGWWTWALLDPATRLGRFAEPSPYVGYYYYMSLTMILGSLVAGATSEGGGAVAFPVMVLALGVPPPIARDFAFAIQSFGMTCAAATIFGLAVPVDGEAIIWGSVGGAAGLVVGLVGVAPNLPPAYAKMFFVSIWAAFAVALYRLNLADRNRRVYRSALESDEERPREEAKSPTTARGEDETSPAMNVEAPISNEEWSMNEDNKGETMSPEARVGTFNSRRKRTAAITATGLFGGLCSSVAGTGLDMATFSILTLYYRVDEKVATPTSVVLMAANSVLGIVCRALGLGRPGEATIVWNFVSVCIPIVVIGAPLGATISARLSRFTVAGLIYFLDAVQFIAALAIVRPWSAPPPNNVWLCVSSGLTLVLGSLFFYKVANWGRRVT